MSVRVPGGFIKRQGRLMPALFGYELRSSLHVREREMLLAPPVIWIGPLTHFRLTRDGRLPFETRYCRGIIELERDRRKYGGNSTIRAHVSPSRDISPE